MHKSRTTTNFKEVPPRAFAGFAMLMVAILIAGCGSSSSSTTTTSTTSSPSTSSAASASNTTGTKCPSGTPATCALSATTPTSGPLSQAPTVTPPKGAPPSTLVIKELIKGTGQIAGPGELVAVNDVGVLYSNGKEFENSFKRGEPFRFTLGKGQVIPGWEQGIPGMRVGGRRELIIPPSLAYGASGSPPKVPPNETLVFVIDLLGI